MKMVAISFLLMAGCSASSVSSVPIPSGNYVFSHRFAEQPNMQSIQVNVRINGFHVVVENPKASDPFPAGVLDEGTLMWHAASEQWIIGQEETDLSLRDVGGCSDGPSVIDLARRIYWTC